LSFSNDAIALRLPKIRALLDDSVSVYPYNAIVTHTASFSAATFSLSISLNEDPQLDASYWAALPRIRVRIQASLGPSDPFTDLIEGYCDTIHIYPISGFVVIEGRDLSATLLDTKTLKNYQNRTPGEIASSIAENHGLTATFRDAGPYAGRLYGNDTTTLTLTQFAKLTTDWDMLVMLAQVGGCDLYVSGSSIYFQTSADMLGPIPSISHADLVDLRMNRMLALADGVDLTVMSWNSAQQEAVAQTFVSTNAGYAGPAATRSPGSYTVMRPNLQPQAALDLATKVAQIVAREAMSIQFRMPADLTLTARQRFSLYGKNTIFDRLFKIDWITRTFRSKSGFSQTVHATLAA
jgi:hypothetical protein